MPYPWLLGLNNAVIKAKAGAGAEAGIANIGDNHSRRKTGKERDFVSLRQLTVHALML